MSRPSDALPLHEVSFVVVDTETTGTRAGDDRIIEVGAVKVKGGKIVDRFGALINPGRSVPWRITQITGITTAMVYDQPTAEVVIPQLLDFIGDGVFVAHNVPFDERFVNGELARLGRPPLDAPTLCTLRLARRLLPGLKSKGLAHVADFFGITIKGRHRAAGDAEATAEVLIRFLSRVAFEHGIDRLDDLLSFQYKSYSRSGRAPKHIKAIRDEILPGLPDRPGVYFMKDRGGAVIYVGKAKSLRSRVRSYFYGVETHDRHHQKLLGAVRTVEWKETGSELAALLEESKLIKSLQPRFNRAQRRYRNRPFIRLDTSERLPRVSWTSYVQNDGAEYFGPLGGRRQAELIVELVGKFFRLRECDDDTLALGRRCMYGEIGRCDAPCVDAEAVGAYPHEVARVRAFLTGEDDETVRVALEAAMRTAAAAMDYEQAATYRDWLRRLDRMRDKQRAVAAPVLEHNAVVVLPGADEGTADLFFIRFGRLAESLTIPAAPDEAARVRLAARLAHHFDPATPGPERYFKREVDEIRILSTWIYANRATIHQVPWHPDDAPEAFLERVLEQAARTDAVTEVGDEEVEEEA